MNNINPSLGNTMQDFNTIKRFIKHNFRHFNAAVVVDAAEAWKKHLNAGNKMLLTMAGAMSTAELGITIAELIRKDKIHAVCCTAANLEEDIFNLVAHNFYERVPHYSDLSPEDEQRLLDRHMNRVTDTCIPEEEAMRRIEHKLLKVWQEADKTGKKYFPYEFIFQLFEKRLLESEYQIDLKDSWVYAAYKKGIPIITPGWEDCTTGNMFVSQVRKGNLTKLSTVK